MIDADGAVIAGERIGSRNVIWAAGVKASLAGNWLGAETDRAGRVVVEPDLTVPGHPEIYVVGDTAAIVKEGKPLPGVAPVAMQSGRYAGRAVLQRLRGERPLPPFSYLDKGNMATISRTFAIMEVGKFKLSGRPAKLAWAFLHIWYLMQNDQKLVVFVNWCWHYFTGKRGTRLIEEFPPEAD